MRICKHCQKPIANRANIFCSKSCAAKFNNALKVRSTESRAKTSASLAGRIRPAQRKRIQSVCIICSTIFERRPCKLSQTCSRNCGNKLAFQNRTKSSGRCLSILYFCKATNETVTLQSNWEVAIAEYLDQTGEVWIRPIPISWTDSKGKSRHYYPDFYLPRLNLYLDPKNGQVMKSDTEKLENVSKLIKLVVGTPEQIIETLVRMPGADPGLPQSECDRDPTPLPSC